MKKRFIRRIEPRNCIVRLPSEEDAMAFAEEAQSIPEQLRNNTDWWLQPSKTAAPGLRVMSGYECIIFSTNGQFYHGVRPALEIPGARLLGFKKGDVFESGGYYWKMTTENSALCDSLLLCMAYGAVDGYLKEFAWKNGFCSSEKEMFYKALEAQFSPNEFYRNASNALKLMPMPADKKDRDAYKAVSKFLIGIMASAEGVPS